jgi:hypothetical protein
MDSFTRKGVLKNAVYTMQMNWTVVDMLWDDSEVAGNVWSDCEDSGGTDCAHGDSDTEWYR